MENQPATERCPDFRGNRGGVELKLIEYQPDCL